MVWDFCRDFDSLDFPLRTQGNLQELSEYLKWCSHERKEFAAAQYIPRTGSVEEFEEFCLLAGRYQNYLLVVEEVAAVAQASYLPPNFGRIVRQGRHQRIGLLWTTQRLNEVSRTPTALTDYWCGFSIAEPADKLALVQRCGLEYTEQVAGLPRFEWRGFEVDTHEMFTDEARLKALWGAPAVWRMPGAPANMAKATR